MYVTPFYVDLVPSTDHADRTRGTRSLFMVLKGIIYWCLGAILVENMLTVRFTAIKFTRKKVT